MAAVTRKAVGFSVMARVLSTSVFQYFGRETPLEGRICEFFNARLGIIVGDPGGLIVEGYPDVNNAIDNFQGFSNDVGTGHTGHVLNS